MTTLDKDLNVSGSDDRISNVNRESNKVQSESISNQEPLEKTEVTPSENVASVPQNDQPMKPKKISKIGLAKKPRERVREKIGNQKLGRKVTKPLGAISCDSIKDEIQVDKSENLSFEIEEDWEKVDGGKLASKETSENDASDSWGVGWGGWGSSLMNAATSITKEVGRGVGSVVEMVEEGVGVPSAEQFAKEQVDEELRIQQTRKDENITEDVTTGDANSSESGDFLGGLTSFVSSAGNKVMNSSLDTLELIGRELNNDIIRIIIL